MLNLQTHIWTTPILQTLTYLRHNLSTPKLAGVDFQRSNLQIANLKDADLTGADLRYAELWLATLDRANLHDVKLQNTKLAASDPWLAHLFEPADIGTLELPEYLKTLAEIRNNNICVINDVLSIIRSLKSRYDSRITLYFRGEACTCWVLNPSVTRNDTRKRNERDALIELITRQPDSFDGLGSTFDQLMMAQHYGLPTRLIDITRNPLVGLFNACDNCNDKAHEGHHANGRVHIFAVPKPLIKPFTSDTISVIANFARLKLEEQNLLLGKSDQTATGEPVAEPSTYEETLRRFLHFIRREKPYFEPNIDPRDFFRVFVVEPKRSFARIRAQSGAFLISAFHRRFERDQVLSYKQWNSNLRSLRT